MSETLTVHEKVDEDEYVFLCKDILQFLLSIFQILRIQTIGSTLSILIIINSTLSITIISMILYHYHYYHYHIKLTTTLMTIPLSTIITTSEMFLQRGVVEWESAQKPQTNW